VTWPTGYACAPGLAASVGPYSLRPLRWEDREPIRAWRNDQIAVLRQPAPLTAADQDSYYRDVVAPQMGMAAPPQVLVAMTEDDRLVGYGGIVHLCWPDRRGEVSFLTDTSRLDDERFAADWRAYLAMLLPLCRAGLGLHKLTTETYEFRTTLIPILEESGFVLEGTLREHHRLGDAWVTSLAHGLILED
jgi:RimJ/RimL family protein N-acetyltransferase